MEKKEEKKEKKQYESKKIYSKKWAKSNVNVSINRDILEQLKISLNGKQTIKSYIEDLIKEKLNTK